MKQILFSIRLSLFFFICCSSKTDDVIIKPSNVTLTATINGKTTENPNGDGSGIVVFTIHADNATNYKIALGDGQIKDIEQGSFAYTYTSSGTNTYNVSVSAYNGNENNFSSVTIPITVLKNSSNLLWAEEFNTDGAPTTTNWSYDIGAGGWGNNELQYYTNRLDNAYVSNGTLKIIAKKENYQQSQYTSARLISKNKFSFQYGTAIIRARVPGSKGTWPAIWMLGDNFSSAGWPACGEIDIMEYSSNLGINKIYGTLHFPNNSGGNAKGSTTQISNVSSEFHIYQLDWSASSIKISVDGVPFFTYANSASLPFNQKFFFILNIAMGGNMGQTIDNNFVSDLMEIDYIRVYQ